MVKGVFPKDASNNSTPPTPSLFQESSNDGKKNTKNCCFL